MKVATITFHWATNYGAVLQAYALQNWLMQNGHETEIVDYLPADVYAKHMVDTIRKRKWNDLKKEWKLMRFRRKNLNCSRRAMTTAGLRRLSEKYSHIICGSDQIWNPSMTLQGRNGKPNGSYFLDFAPVGVKKIGYAASFGTTRLSEDYRDFVQPMLKQFAAISVREQTGVHLVESMAAEACVVCDPTFLLQKNDYEAVVENQPKGAAKIFSYVLHNDSLCKKIAQFIQMRFEQSLDTSNNVLGLEGWLGRIAGAELVVTNSFHGVALSIILNTPFIAVLIPNSGMNDRIETLLKRVGLSDRIVAEYREEKLKALCESTINWTNVNQAVASMRDEGIAFLDRAIGSEA